MTDAMLVLEHLLAKTSEFEVTVRAVHESSVDVSLAPVLAGGAHRPFELTVAVPSEGKVPQVFEREPRQLPASCMERHINSNGSFCMSWAPSEDSIVVDAESARRFWRLLTRFLAAQVAATQLRRWPGAEHARAHGNAAEHQAAAEKLAGEICPSVSADLRAGLLSADLEHRAGHCRLNLRRRGGVVAQVRIPDGTLMSSKVRCVCDGGARDGIPIRRCKGHGQKIAELAIAVHHWHVFHHAYVRDAVAGGVRCCGTMDMCEVRTAQEQLEH